MAMLPAGLEGAGVYTNDPNPEHSHCHLYITLFRVKGQWATGRLALVWLGRRVKGKKAEHPDLACRSSSSTSSCWLWRSTIQGQGVDGTMWYIALPRCHLGTHPAGVACHLPVSTTFVSLGLKCTDPMALHCNEVTQWLHFCTLLWCINEYRVGQWSRIE